MSQTYCKQDVVEAYKSIIDFNKTVISISSSILAGVIAFIVYQDIDFVIRNYIGILFLIISILLSVRSFGLAIKTIKDSKSRPSTISYANFGAFSLIVGIVAILIIKQPKINVNEILNHVEVSTYNFSEKLLSKQCIQIKSTDDIYEILYLIDKKKINVKYSIKKKRVISIISTAAKRPYCRTIPISWQTKFCN
jgi:hypothetical protein